MGAVGSAFEDFSICWAGYAGCSVDWDAIAGLGTVGALLLSAWLAWKAHREASENKSALEARSKALIAQYLFHWLESVEVLQHLFYRSRGDDYMGLAMVLHRPSPELVDRAAVLSVEEVKVIASFVARDQQLKAFADRSFKIGHIVGDSDDGVARHLGAVLELRNTIEPMCERWWTSLFPGDPVWMQVRNRLENKSIDPTIFPKL